MISPRVTRAARALLPWLVGAAFLVWVFLRVPLRGFADALGQGQFHWLLPSILPVMTAIFLADTLALSLTFTWFTAPLGYREALSLRGASYLLSVVNYNLGQGMLILFVNRSKQIPVAVATGTVLLLMGVNLVVLLGLATFGVLVTHDPHAVALRPYVFTGLAGFAAYLVVVVVKPRWLTRFAVLGAAFQAGLGGHLKAVLIRLPHIAMVFLAHFIAMRAFGIRPPLWSFLTLMPVVSLVTALPISVQGLGTTQLAAVYFFAPYAEGSLAHREATVLAYSLTTSVLAILFMLGMGLGFLKRGLKLLAAAHPVDDLSARPPVHP